MTGSVRPRIEIVERRQTERAIVDLMAFAVTKTNDKFACCVRNISDTGAMLEFVGNDIAILPTTFQILISGTEIRLRVKTIWREKRRLGVMFLP